MTTEEINKAAEEYATKLDVSTFDYKAARKDFREGADFVNKHWQEKTRWIPVEERLPKVRKTPFFIIVQAYDNSDKFRANIETFLVKDERDLLWVWMNCKYWKEIE